MNRVYELSYTKEGIPQKANLSRALHRFDSNGKYVTVGEWSIGKGGYDCWWFISFDGVEVIDCVLGELELCTQSYGYDEEFSTRTLAEYVCSVYSDCVLAESYKNNPILIESDVDISGDKGNPISILIRTRSDWSNIPTVQALAKYIKDAFSSCNVDTETSNKFVKELENGSFNTIQDAVRYLDNKIKNNTKLKESVGSMRILREARNNRSDIQYDGYATVDGTTYYVYCYYTHTPQYTTEHAVIRDDDTGAEVGHGKSKWINRPWHRFSFEEALTYAIEQAFGKDFIAKNAGIVKSSSSAQQVISALDDGEEPQAEDVVQEMPESFNRVLRERKEEQYPPKAVKIDLRGLDIDYDEYDDIEDYLDENIADILSDEFGYCVYSIENYDVRNGVCYVQGIEWDTSD